MMTDSLWKAVPVEIAFILEPHDGGYRARLRHPVAAEVTGATRYAAAQALEAVLQAAGVPEPGHA